MRFARPQPRPRHGPLGDLTPMVDVILQLIIFFVFTARLGQISRSQVDLPEQPGEDQPAAPAPTLPIVLAADGSILLAGRPIDAASLGAAVRAALDADPASPAVELRLDQSLPAAAADPVFAALAAAGVPQLRVSTRTPKDAPPR